MTQINYINFDRLKFLAKCAGWIGIIQSIIWIGLTFTGIISYYCVFDYSSDPSTINSTKYGHAIGWTFYHLYFEGDCEIKNLPYINSFILDSTESFKSNNLHIFMWVYMVISFLWFCSSITMMTHIRKDKLKQTLIFLHIWIIICFAICALDFTLAILFGLDYNRFNTKSYEYNLKGNKANIDPFAVLLVTAQIVSFSLMVIALRGFVLWIINFWLMLYFGRETLIINELDNEETDLIHKQFSSDSHSINSRPAINAFDTRNDLITVSPINSQNENSNNINTNPIKPTEEILTIENTSAIQRASLISNELLKERQSKFAQYEQYPAPAAKPEIARKPQKPEPYNYLNGNRRLADTRFPEPDYSPVAPRKLLPIQNRSFQ